MKLSLAWIFDHIEADWREQDLDWLLQKFNETTAEIEGIERISYDLSPYALGRVLDIVNGQVRVLLPEWKVTVQLPPRKDITMLSHDDYDNYVVMVKTLTGKKPADNGSGVRWAVCKDFGLDKSGELALFTCPTSQMDGSWRGQFECEDVLLDVDNKSITHRPDMWGHRGFAREIAAILSLPLKPLEEFLATHPIQLYKDKAPATKTTSFAIENQEPSFCTRYSGLYFPTITNQGANLFFTSRLLKVGVRSIDAIVDLANYVMLDLSQPVHAFDAAHLGGKKIVIRTGAPREKMTLLDEREIALTSEDLIIADEQKPLALAGVMGGFDSGVSKETSSIFFESAHFDAAAVRRSAARHRTRTESSARFEKTLDANQVTDAPQRFIKLARDIGLNFTVAEAISCVGEPQPPLTITVSKDYLQKRAGFEIADEQVQRPLEALGFAVHIEQGDYHITVPSFRATKDVQHREDILEEVARFYGFNNIALTLPTFAKQPASLQYIRRVRAVKKFLQAAGIDEQQNYAFYDEPFLAQLGWSPPGAAEVINPASEHQKRLATSLIPNLLKNVHDNYVDYDELAFYEWGRTWQSDAKSVTEKKSLAAVWFSKREPIDFYSKKQVVNNLFGTLGFQITWKQEATQNLPWMSQYQTARITAGDTTIGYGGMVDTSFLSRLDVLDESSAFFFELDGEFLSTHPGEAKKFQPLSKYQDVTFDLSFFVPLTLEAQRVHDALIQADELVCEVKLIDFFENPSWAEKRALAFHLIARHPEKTLNKDEIEVIRANAIAAANELGATLRA